MPFRDRPLVRSLLSLALVCALAFAVAPAVLRTHGATADAAPVADGRDVGFSLYGSILSMPAAELAADLDRVKAVGGTWIRMDMNWPTVQPTGPTSWTWAPVDRVVDAIQSRGLKVLAVVAYTPQWARPAGTPGTQPPTNPDNYANFVKAAAQRYAPKGVHMWEIWNEPNNGAVWSPKSDPAAYTTLLKKSYTAIHGVDSGATVVVGGLSPASDTTTSNRPSTFLRGIYTNGGKGYFDALGHHPYSFPYPSTTQADWNAFYQTSELYSIMSSNGDGAKKIWATEVGFPTGTQTGRSVSDANQAAYTVEMIKAWTAFPFHGPIMVYSMRDEADNISNFFFNFGLVKLNGTPKPSYTAVMQLLRSAQDVKATAGLNTATVTWNAPTWDYGTAITGYKVVASPGGANVTVDGAARTAVVPVAGGTAYTFTVQPIHGGVAGVASVASASVTPASSTVVPGLGSSVEGNTGTRTLSVPVTLDAAATQTVSVNYQTYSATAAGWAVVPGDYGSTNGTVTFTAGQTSRTISVTVAGDSVKEGNEVFLVTFSNPQNAKVGGFYGLGAGVIVDDD